MSFDVVSCSKSQREPVDEVVFTYLKAAAKGSGDNRRLRADDHLVKLELMVLAKESEVTESSRFH
jgi:hypothetical protein